LPVGASVFIKRIYSLKILFELKNGDQGLQNSLSRIIFTIGKNEVAKKWA
jgi:hypothetical protein